MGDNRLAGAPIAGDDVDHAAGQARLLADLPEQKGGKRGVFRRFQHHRVARGKGGRDLPCQHQKGEVPRDHLTADADGLMPRQFRVAQLGQPSVMVEMPLGQGDIDIAGLADRLAIVEGFQHREQAGVFLEQAGKGIKVFGACVAREPCPFRESLGCGGDRGVHIGGRALGDLGQLCPRGGVLRGKSLARRGEPPVDEMTKGRAALGDPCQRLGGAFGGGAVIHRVEDVTGGHRLGLSLPRGRKTRVFRSKTAVFRFVFLRENDPFPHAIGCRQLAE